ncbi:MAG: cytochrome b/b6 domain-containing protein [Halioglobus sp.]
MPSPHPLWDIPTRVFHWALVICVGLAWWSAEFERYQIHQWTGYTLIVLLLTRIIWGVVGSVHSRFNDFLAGPQTVLTYLRGQDSPTPGHNPLGGWSVLALISVLLLQAVSGLFNSDDILFSGPLYYAADQQLQEIMAVVHDVAFNLLLGLVALHLLAVLYHQFWRKEALVQAMWSGIATGRAGLEAPVSPWRAVLIAVVVGGLLWLGLEQAPQPQSFW